MYPTRYASFFKRLLAHIVDVLVAGSIAALIILPFVFHFLFRLFSDPPFDRWSLLGFSSGFPDWIFGSIPYYLIFVWGFAFFVLQWLYFAIFESSPRQATPGKMLMGIFVTDLQGRRLSLLRALGRTLAKEISRACCYVGYLLALFTARNQAFHDFLTGALVLEPDFTCQDRQAAPPQPGRQTD